MEHEMNVDRLQEDINNPIHWDERVNLQKFWKAS